MPHYVAFLRGINLGNRRLKMTELAARFVEMKFTDVSTFIASGNVIFKCAERDEAKLTIKIEQHLEKKLGYPVDTFVRTVEEVAAVAAFAPFAKADMEAAHGVYCSFLKAPLTTAQAKGLIACRTKIDEFCVKGREFYWLVRIKSNESTVWQSPQMRALKLPSSSARNLTTLRKLAELFGAAS